MTTEVVPDASVVAKWFLPHEQGSAHAHTILAAAETANLRFAAPDQMRTEVVRVLQLAVRERLYSADEGLARVHAFIDLPVTYLPNELLLEEAFALSCEYRIAFYDSLYLALAQLIDVPFVTADLRFMNLARQRSLPLTVWYEDFAPGLPAE